MKKQSFGTMVAAFRKKNGMTQLELAEKMGVTDKAVSKWERDLSFPDIGSIPKLAEIFGVSVDELMQGKTNIAENQAVDRVSRMIRLSLNGVALAMGIAVTVLSFMNKTESFSAIGMLGIGLFCISVLQLKNTKK